jgi:protein-tyrosine phosphatase
VETVEARQRVLALEGGRNFRDMGGYATADGRRLRWGRLYRSGSLAALSDAAYARLAELQVRVICDLRTTSERETQPVDWGRVPELSYWARDYDLSFGDLRALLAADMPAADQARAAMVTAYRELPFEQAASYAELFRCLAEGELPLVFNCSAGKDRTGVAAALILSALGVAEETIVEDYLLTSAAVDAASLAARSRLAHIPPDVAAAILGVDPGYIRAALTAIEAAHGSIETYLAERLGVDAESLRRLQANLLE